MKTLLLVAASLACTSVFAQNSRIDRDRFQNEPGYRDSLTALFPDNNRRGQSKIRPTHPLYIEKQKATGIVTLPQDNMPCIVPDSTKTVRIPNAWRSKKGVPYRPNPPRMPNLVKPDFLSEVSKQP